MPALETETSSPESLSDKTADASGDRHTLPVQIVIIRSTVISGSHGERRVPWLNGYVCRVSTQHNHHGREARDAAGPRVRLSGPPSTAEAGRVRRRRVDWRQGGSSLRRWDLALLSVALMSAGLGVFAAGAAARFLPGVPVLSTIALWIGLSVAIVAAFARGKPAGLLRFRAVDVIWGVGLGVLARLAQGIAIDANSNAFPVATELQSGEGWLWVIQSAAPAALIGPIVEEFFFRAVVLVCVYQLLRRALGFLAAASAALVASACGFVAIHALFAPLGAVDAVTLFVLGALLGVVVLFTGRIWGAVILHMVYNVIYLALAVVGSAPR